MSGGFQIGPWASESSGAAVGGTFRARIEKIDDPKGRNRVAVRIFGYQDNQGNIIKDQLEWVHCLSHDSQIPGATSTHNYYPGAEVMVVDNGTEKFILGAISGFDGEKRLAQNPWGVDNTDNQNADVPNVNRKSDKDTTTRVGSAIMGPPGDQAGANNYFKYNNWMSNLVKAFQYSTGKGERPAPWGTGDPSKQDQLQSIGLQKNIQGSDVLNLIQSLDGNQSGAIKAAIQLILNLRNNGFTSAMNVIGSGPFNNALNQFATQFGSTTQNDLINLVLQLLTYIRQVQTFQDKTFYGFCVDNTVINIITFMQNQLFAVGSDIITGMTAIYNTAILSAGNGSVPFYGGLLISFNLLFQTAVHQAFTGILNQLNTLASNLNNDQSTFVTMFGGQTNLIQFAQALLAIANFLGIPQIALNTIGGGIIGIALGGGLAQIFANATQQPHTQSNSNQNVATQLLAGLLGMFHGNNIALQEILGGGLVKKFLSNNPMKYQQVDRNDGQSVLKRFPD